MDLFFISSGFLAYLNYSGIYALHLSLVPIIK
jgi:hypothetical protein